MGIVLHFGDFEINNAADHIGGRTDTVSNCA